MEMWDLYDNERKKVGMIERSQPMPKGVNRLVVHICIFNSKGEMLIQQRSATKKTHPNVWDITLGGCVQAGETSWQGAQRELSEELGLTYDFSNERAYFTVNFEGGFDDFFLIEKDVALSEVSFKDNEVQAVKWASKKEILDKIESGDFINFYKPLISMVFEMQKNRGCMPKEK